MKVTYQNLKVIKNKKGNLIKIYSKRDFFRRIAESYISEINPNKIKAWRFHKKTNQKLVLIEGNCIVVVFSNKKIKKFKLSYKKPRLLQIPKKTWYGFKNLSSKKKVKILNFIDKKYDENEIERKKINEIRYNW